MKISRIVTIFEQWHFLTWLSNDPLFQNDIEFILVDDGSSQPLPRSVGDVIRERGIKLITLPRNAGRCVARNAGAQAATGEYLDFIDGDDLPLPLAFDPEWDRTAPEIVSFPFEVHGQGKSMQHSFVRNPLLDSPGAPEGFLDPRPAALLWRRQYFIDAGGFDPRWEMAEDLELLLRTKNARISFARKPKQSYNEQPRSDAAEVAYSAQRLRIYQKLAADRAEVSRLISQEARMLHWKTTWFLFRQRHDRFLFRAALSLLWNLGKARLGLVKRDR